MDAIALLMALFLNLSEPCNAMPASETRIGGTNYLQLNYLCGSKAYTVWERWCEDGYWGRPFMLVETHSMYGVYMNRFGELHTAWHVPLSEVYFPACGA